MQAAQVGRHEKYLSRINDETFVFIRVLPCKNIFEYSPFFLCSLINFLKILYYDGGL